MSPRYGTGEQLVKLLDSHAGLIAAEPQEMFEDKEVRRAAEGLRDLLCGRLGGHGVTARPGPSAADLWRWLRQGRGLAAADEGEGTALTTGGAASPSNRKSRQLPLWLLAAAAGLGVWLLLIGAILWLRIPT
jgi:hypothetical protein